MSTIEEVLGRTKTITFDCYGTLIDWRAGVTQAFRELFGPATLDQAEELFKAYVRTEAEIEAEGYRSYREVLSTVAERLAERFGVPLAPNRAGLLAEMLPHWPPFADTNEALARLERRFRLGVLSNIDRDLFAGTAREFDVTFDFVVTAEDVRSYKPAHGHFERLLSTFGKSDEVLHVAQSLFHDGVPTGELNIPYVWINRYNEANTTSVRPLAVYTDLASLAEAAENL